ncbi:MAG: dihydrodipicolinate synthase family protein [Planctomycetes bacterium]|nr:dihydrodipicolinate synthase family protein [Planctomycetota bacterium]
MELKGVMPALLTCYDKNGDIATDNLEDFIGFFLERGCNGFFVGGSSGEGLLQDVEERAEYTAAVVSAVAGEVPVIAHVGSLATQDACELSRRAAEAGADLVGSVLPIYYAISTEGTVDYYRSISEAADLPVLVYYLAQTGAVLEAKEFAETIATIPGVSAMKYTSAELETFCKIIDLTNHNLSMIMGCDQLFLPALTVGADAAIGTTYNFMPEIFVGIYEAYQEGNIQKAQTLMQRGFQIIFALKQKYPVLEASREILRIRGWDTGHCRGPLEKLTEEQCEELREDLERIDFFSDPIV